MVDGNTAVGRINKARYKISNTIQGTKNLKYKIWNIIQGTKKLRYEIWNTIQGTNKDDARHNGQPVLIVCRLCFTFAILAFWITKIIIMILHLLWSADSSRADRKIATELSTTQVNGHSTLWKYHWT